MYSVKIGEGVYSKVYTERCNLRARKVLHDVDVAIHEYAISESVNSEYLIKYQPVLTSNKMTNQVSMRLYMSDLKKIISLPPRDSCRCLTEKNIWKIIFCTALGLCEMHRCGIIHGDLKPDNIVCDLTLSDGSLAPGGLISLAMPELRDQPLGINIAIIDYGLSIVQTNEPNTIEIQAWAYRAPELSFKYNSTDIGGVLHNHVGTAADMWSMGHIMYNIIAKRSLFKYNGGDPCDEYARVLGACERDGLNPYQRMLTLDSEQIGRVLNDNMRESLESLPNLREAGLVDIMSRCFSIDPRKRATARDVVEWAHNIGMRMGWCSQKDLDTHLDSDIRDDFNRYGSVFNININEHYECDDMGVIVNVDIDLVNHFSMRGLAYAENIWRATRMLDEGVFESMIPLVVQLGCLYIAMCVMCDYMPVDVFNDYTVDGKKCSGKIQYAAKYIMAQLIKNKFGRM